MSKVRRLPRADHWAAQIRAQIGKTVDSILEIGRLLLKAKADLSHGEWGRLFDEHLLPFGQGKANRLMAVASHPVLSNSAHGPNLPPSWHTLYELTKVPEPALLHAFRDGLVTADMERKHVTALMPPKPRKEPDDDHWMLALAKLRRTIHSVIDNWPPHVLALVPETLRDVANELERNADRGVGDTATSGDPDHAVEGGSDAAA